MPGRRGGRSHGRRRPSRTPRDAVSYSAGVARPRHPRTVAWQSAKPGSAGPVPARVAVRDHARGIVVCQSTNSARPAGRRHVPDHARGIVVCQSTNSARPAGRRHVPDHARGIVVCQSTNSARRARCRPVPARVGPSQADGVLPRTSRRLAVDEPRRAVDAPAGCRPPPRPLRASASTEAQRPVSLDEDLRRPRPAVVAGRL